MNLALSNEEGFVRETPIMQFVENVLKKYPIANFIGVPQFNIPLTVAPVASEGKVKSRLDRLGVEN
jgi:hypothetical protein